MKHKTVRLSIRLTEKQRDWLEKKADQLSVSISDIIRMKIQNEISEGELNGNSNDTRKGI